MDDRLAIVHVCYSRPEAEVMLSVLHASGIPAFIHSREVNAVSGHFAVAFGGMQIMVPAAAAEDARAILGSADESGSTNFESAAFWEAPVRNSLWIAFGWLFGCVYFPVWLRKRK